jgi:hypothetical protein
MDHSSFTADLAYLETSCEPSLRVPHRQNLFLGFPAPVEQLHNIALLGQHREEQLIPDFAGAASSCPGCMRSAADLKWIYFEDSARAWDEFGDEAGWIVVCSGCQRQVDFFSAGNNEQ